VDRFSSLVQNLQNLVTSLLFAGSALECLYGFSDEADFNNVYSSLTVRNKTVLGIRL